MQTLFKLNRFVLLILLLSIATNGYCSSGEQDTAADDATMLMFVGEDLNVLSIASRHAEPAWQAPAIANVVTRQEMRQKGVQTLGYALDTQPGFYMGRQEWGTRPYLRGIRDSVVFLFDEVPVGSDSTKMWSPLDYQLSMASVKRVEIVRGPGSVLWGPDAYAGIVNVVPLSGKDLSGLETGAIYDSLYKNNGGYLNCGYDEGTWNSFFSIAARRGRGNDDRYDLVSFWGDLEKPVPPEERYGDARPETDYYVESYGSLNLADKVSLSGRVADFSKSYVMRSNGLPYSWNETRHTPSGSLKAELNQEVAFNSTIRVTGAYAWMNPDHTIIDRKIEHREKNAMVEALYLRSFWSGRGKLTGGAAYREKRVDNAPIWNGYLTDYLDPQNEGKFGSLPIITEEDYRLKSWSAFSQYRHVLGDFEALLGMRNDWYENRKDFFSYNSGLVWRPTETWMVKALFGTAYRSAPFTRQTVEGQDFDLENIRSANLQVAWKPSKKFEISACGFNNRIKNHLYEDLYAGLSQPNHQEINGLELELGTWIGDSLELKSNFTMMDHHGPEETTLYNDYTTYTTEGETPHYVYLVYPFDVGPERLLNCTATWHPEERLAIYGRLRHYASNLLIYPHAQEPVPIKERWLIDFGVDRKDVFIKGLDLNVAVRNATNRDYFLPGTYSLVRGQPFHLSVTLAMRW